jgi:hypothetical protein
VDKLGTFSSSPPNGLEQIQWDLIQQTLLLVWLSPLWVDSTWLGLPSKKHLL